MRRTKARKLPRLGQRMESRSVDPIRLCERTGIDPIEMGALIACEREATPEEFEALANALACYPEDLFSPKVGGAYMDTIRGDFKNKGREGRIFEDRRGEPGNTLD